MDKQTALVTTMVATWIAQNGVGTVAQYNLPAAVAMLIKWADEDRTTVTGLDADDVQDVIESHRVVAA